MQTAREAMKKSRLIYLTLNTCHFEHGDALGYHVLRGRSDPWTLCKDSDGLQIFQVHRLRFRMFRTKIRTAEILWNHCWSFLQQSDRLFTVKDKVRGGWGGMVPNCKGPWSLFSFNSNTMSQDWKEISPPNSTQRHMNISSVFLC